MEIILGMAMTYWIIVALANAVGDVASVITGNTNPRIERAKQRAKTRGTNPAWQQIKGELTGWLGDVVADARTEANRRREEKRDRQAEARRRRDLEEHPTVDAEYTITDPPGSTSPEPGAYNPDPSDPSVIDMATPDPRPTTCNYGVPVATGNCGWATCPDHGHLNRPTETDNQQTTGTTNHEGDTIMSGYEGGLDGFLDYLGTCAKNLLTYKSEQVISQMANSEMGPESIAKVQYSQEKAAEAAAAFLDAQQFIANANKGAQEQTTTETGAKDFLLNR